ncbi:MAG: EAL domain-containing protein, partial [Nitratireductor sp.]
MAKRTKNLPSIPDFIWLALVAATVFALSSMGAFTYYQNDVTEIREKFSQRSASGEVVFVGIDKRTLDKVGVWPWPRSVHAQIIDKLIALEVAEIGVDIDFSSPSTPEQDQRFAQSLENAGGLVVLPAFMQQSGINANESTLEINKPIDDFAKHSWLASVNVLPDVDGIVRSFPTDIVIDGELLSSMPQVLSGEFGGSSGKIAINFSVDPSTVPTISVADLLDDKVQLEAIKGKTVMLGASAVELRDNFAVPVHGILPGALVQVLAAETLKQNIERVDLNPHYVLAVAAILILLFTLLIHHVYRIKAALPKYAGLALFSVLTEAVGFYLFKAHNIGLPSVQVHAFIFLCAVMMTIIELDLRRLLLNFSAVKNKNTQYVLNQVLQDNDNGVLIVNQEGDVLNINQRARKYLALPRTIVEDVKVIHMLPQCIIDDIINAVGALQPDQGAEMRKGMVDIDNNLYAGKLATLEYTITVSSLAKLEDKQIEENIVISVTTSDVTKRLEQERLIEHNAKYDELTGAQRRSEFRLSIDKRLAQLTGQNECTVLAFNIHRFKTINVVLGRDVGDEVLKQFKGRVEAVFDESADFARLSGDVFAVAVSGKKSPIEIQVLANKLISLTNEPFQIGKAVVNVGMRVGAASAANLISKNATQLIENAEVALDEACKISGNGFVGYQEGFSSVLAKARTIENDLWQSIDQDQIHIHYQPQVDIHSGALTGLEALVRWQHPKLGPVSPADFVEVAEANGFIDKLGEWVLNKACEDALLLPDHISIAVNVSPIQVKRTDLVALVKTALNATGLPAHRLHIEITEAGFLEATDEVVATLKELREMGVWLALDDFGTGFASLGYFAKFPINKIKLDQMFIRTLKRGDQNEAIVRSVKELANGLDLKMICEGIETQEQLELLREIDVHEGQGYLFSKPQPLNAILAMVE